MLGAGHYPRSGVRGVGGVVPVSDFIRLAGMSSSGDKVNWCASPFDHDGRL